MPPEKKPPESASDATPDSEKGVGMGTMTFKGRWVRIFSELAQKHPELGNAFENVSVLHGDNPESDEIHIQLEGFTALELFRRWVGCLLKDKRGNDNDEGDDTAGEEPTPNNGNSAPPNESQIVAIPIIDIPPGIRRSNRPPIDNMPPGIQKSARPPSGVHDVSGIIEDLEDEDRSSEPPQLVG